MEYTNSSLVDCEIKALIIAVDGHMILIALLHIV